MAQHAFILTAFDRDLWCEVLQCRFQVEDIGALLAAIDVDADDFEPDAAYSLDQDEIIALTQRFALNFPNDRLEGSRIEVALEPVRTGVASSILTEVPYLVHTNFELPLMLDGRKKLARMVGIWPEAEEAFDRWVDQGTLHKEVIMKPVPEGLKAYAIDRSREADRFVYYALKGEEWRIPAMELLLEAGTSIGGVEWSEHHERLEGMLFGYENWQNDWWIEHANRTSGGIGGLAFCCAVDSEGLAWMRSAGYKALPPNGPEELRVKPWARDDRESMTAFLTENETSVALVRFKVHAAAQREFFPVGKDKVGPFVLSRQQVPDLNRNLKRQVDVVLTRSSQLST